MCFIKIKAAKVTCRNVFLFRGLLSLPLSLSSSLLLLVLALFYRAPSFAQDDVSSIDGVNNTVLHVEFGVDYNRDGQIDFASTDEPFKPTLDDVSVNNPYVFWLNDDNDYHNSETDGNDVPGTRGHRRGEYNYGTKGIDGTRDLIDFFPIAINFYNFFELIPENKAYTFILKHEDFALNIVYSSMTTDNSHYYLKEVIKGNLEGLVGSWQLPAELHTLTSHTVTREGIKLPNDFIEQIKKKNNQGVLLAEVRGKSSKPLILEIKNKAGHVILTAELPLKLVEVEDMYAQVNIRGAAFADGENNDFDIGAVVTALTTAREGLANILPKSFKADKNIALLHGFDVDEQNATAWHAEVFKRLYQSGSNAYYTGVTWLGNAGFPAKLNYWGNVEGALNTATVIQGVLSTLPDLTIVAHSLGNMVISEAIQNHNFTPSNYFMLNPSVATEAYLASQLAGDVNNDGFNDMSHPEWHPYQQRLWSTDWFRLFELTDGRNKLTWQNQFGLVTTRVNVHQFYSSGDEVLAHSQGEAPTTWGAIKDYGDNAWIIQEKFKGRQIDFGSRFMAGNSIGGWGFNCDDWANDSYLGILSCAQSDMILPNAANELNGELRERPFFRRANDELDLYGANGSAVAITFHNHLLSRYVPALSHAAGSTGLSEDVTAIYSVDMNTNDFKKDWPVERGFDDDDQNWLHSDAKDIAYRYVYTLYDLWVEKGDLK